MNDIEIKPPEKIPVTLKNPQGSTGQNGLELDYRKLSGRQFIEYLKKLGGKYYEKGGL